MRLAIFTACAIAALFAGTALGAPAREPRPSYERDILPLFRARCLGCHGVAQPEAGLDLRSWGDARQGGRSGAAVVPGSPEKSLLYQVLADGRMPRGGARLTAAELQ